VGITAIKPYRTASIPKPKKGRENPSFFNDKKNST
jgi:hypothetical protein